MEQEKKFITYEQIFGSEIAKDARNYTEMRDIVDMVHAENIEPAVVNLGRLVSISISGSTININYEGVRLTIEVYEGPILKIIWRRCEIDTFLHSELQPYSGEINKNGNKVQIGGLSVTIGDDGTITFSDEATGSIRVDHPPVMAGEKVRLVSEITDSEGIYGTGERAFPMNLRGNNITFWNHDANGKYGPGDDPLYINIPIFYHLNLNAGYFIFFNNPYKCNANLCFDESNRTVLEFDGGGLEYYLSFGKLDDLMGRYYNITGKPAMPPYWSLGYHQSRYSYESEDEVKAIAESFRKNDLPISAIHLDIDYMTGFRIFTVDPSKFPKFDAMTQELAKDGIRTVAIIDPGVKVDDAYEIFREGINNSFFVQYDEDEIVEAPVWPGMSAFPDFLREDVRTWWGGKYKLLLNRGVSGIWHDMNEPATFTLSGDNTLPENSVHSVGKHRSVHNLYAKFMAIAGYNGMISERPYERPFILSRSGWAGLQKYAWTWTGDTEGTWAELKQTVSTIVNLGLSGLPFAGVDIGGFSDSPSNELFLRWFQMGTFLPFFRVHSAKGTRMREPWLFGEKILGILRNFMKLRYRLLPYIYTASYIASTGGPPLVRPLFWLGDPATTDDDENFLFGDDILVCSILEPNQKHRTIRLPEGEWIDFWKRNIEKGLMVKEVTLDTIPLYVRSGAVIPMQGSDSVELHIFPGAELHGECYLDDGTLNPKFQYYHISGILKDESVDLRVEKTGNSETKNRFNIVFETSVKKFRVNDKDYVLSDDHTELWL